MNSTEATTIDTPTETPERTILPDAVEASTTIPEAAVAPVVESAIEPAPSESAPISEVPTVAEATVPVAETVEQTPAAEPVSEAVESEATAEPVRVAPTPAVPSQHAPVVPPSPQPHEFARIAQDLQIRRPQVEAVARLLDEENTVPFITRYRKEQTGGLDEEVIRRIQLRIKALRALAERKQSILKSIAIQGKLTDELTAAILECEQVKRLEDLYLPYKQKKRTLASDAKDKGLEPAALAIWTRDDAVGGLDDLISGLVDADKQLNATDDVIAGLRHIIAEIISESVEVRGVLRAFLRDSGLLTAKRVDGVPDAKAAEFRDYVDFKEPIRMSPPHRILAINRGEQEKVLSAKLDCDAQRAKHIAFDHLPLIDHPYKDFLIPAMEDAVDRLLLPSLEREIRRDMTEFAQDHAVDIFARNLRSLLLKAPLGGKKILALDPGMRTGCKVAVLDEQGLPVEHGVIYPHPPQKDIAGAKRKLEQLIRKYQLDIVAIGNGTGCRETEQLVSDLIADLQNRHLNPPPQPAPIEPVVAETATPTVAEVIAPPPLPPLVDPAPVESTTTTTIAGVAETVSTVVGEAATTASSDTAVAPIPVPPAPVPPAAPPKDVISLDGLPEAPREIAYVIVNEAGASDYSASPIAKEEFPDLDATVRGTISIGRRLQDPLAELVKVDPQHVGVGLYQHDVRPKHLKESLEAVIESCVNAIGVDLNTASVPLLRNVSGLNQLVAREIVEFRKKNGPFQDREQLKQVPQVGESRFTQSVGFLKIRDGAEPLDSTWVHPETYPVAREILTGLGFATSDLRDPTKLAELREKLKEQNPEALGNLHKLSGATIRDMFETLAKPGRDVREDRPKPIFRTGVLELEDLKPGMELKGEILNVVDFGAFVDVGLKDSGLIHVSQMANRFIKSPYEVVAVGDVVSVWVNSVDLERKRVSLSLIAPGTERQQERPREPRPEREQREQRPPRPPRPDQRPDQPRQDQQQRPPQQSMGPRGPSGPPRPQGDRPGFVPRPQQPPPQSTIPPPVRPGVGKPSGLYRAPIPGGGPGPRSDAPPPTTKPKTGKPAKLSDQQKKGKAALNTFAELAAMFVKPEDEAKKPQAPTPPEPTEQVAPVESQQPEAEANEVREAPQEVEPTAPADDQPKADQ